MNQSVPPEIVEALRNLYVDLRLAVDEATVALRHRGETTALSKSNRANFLSADRKVAEIVRHIAALQDR